MSFWNELLAPPVRGNGRGGEVDQVLSRFFRSEMPDPWPAWKAPAAEVVAPPRPWRRPLFWSRFALAASVALLLASQLWLANSYRAPEPAEAVERSGPVDVAKKPQVSADSDAEGTPGGVTPVRPVLKNMR